MTDISLSAASLPSENPAVTIPAGWRLIAGSSTALRLLNGIGLLSTGNVWGGWEYSSSLNPTANVVSAACSYRRFSNSDGRVGVTLLGATGGYRLRAEEFIIFIDRIDGNLSGTFTELGNFSVERFVDDEYTLEYNISTGLLTAKINGTSVLTATDTTYAASTLYGGAVSRSFDRAAVSEISVFNVAAAATLVIATALTPSASRTDTCTGFANGAATLSFSGVSVPVTISSGSFTWTVPMLSDGVTWPRLPATGQTITLTQGGTTANTTANINLPTGHQTLRVGDVVGGAVANFAVVVTDNDRMLGYHFLAAGNPLTTDDTAYFVTSDNYWVYRNGDVGADTASLPRTDILYVQDTTSGAISSHSITLSEAGITFVSEASGYYLGLGIGIGF